MQEEDKIAVKGLSFYCVAEDGNTVQVDSKNGKIIKIRPLHFDWKYRPEEFESGRKTLGHSDKKTKRR